MASSVSLRCALALLFAAVYPASTAWACVMVSGAPALALGDGDGRAGIFAVTLGAADGAAKSPVPRAPGWLPGSSTAAAPTAAAPATIPAGSSQRRPPCPRLSPGSAHSPAPAAGSRRPAG